MTTRSALRSVLVPVAAAALVSVGLAAPGQAVGPSYPHTTVLKGQFKLIPLKNAAMLTRTQHGYLYRAGQQNSHLEVTEVAGGLRFHDSGTRELRTLDSSCTRQSVSEGIAAVCPVPGDVSAASPMLLEVWPRLGNDFVDGSTLPAAFQMSVLADAGADTVLLGAGDDFVNGAQGNDIVRGGAGDDWIRTGRHHDNIDGGPGDDKLVGSGGRDAITGGTGADWMGGGAGADRLFSRDGGRDVVSCGGGRDRGLADRIDRRRRCERTVRALATVVDEPPTGEPTPQEPKTQEPTPGGPTAPDDPSIPDNPPAPTPTVQDVGPWYPYTTVLNGQYPLIPLKDAAMITRTPYGYLYRAGQQDSHLEVTEVAGGLRFHDSGTRELRTLDASCTRQSVPTGIAAVCPVPDYVTTATPMMVEIWPRLGDDYVDASSLSASFQTTVLADAGFDTVYVGDGADFVNGAQDGDVVRGGAGNDWIRTGIGNDDISGGSGSDKLVGDDGNDVLRGDAGLDRMYGGSGADRLFANDGVGETPNCGGGSDTVTVDSFDRQRECETVTAG